MTLLDKSGLLWWHSTEGLSLLIYIFLALGLFIYFVVKIEEIPTTTFSFALEAKVVRRVFVGNQEWLLLCSIWRR